MNNHRKLESTLKRIPNRITRIESYSDSVIGTRDYQQDSYQVFIDDVAALAVICDGMGGMNGGEKASELAVKRFVRDFYEESPMKNLPRFLEAEAVHLDYLVHDIKDENGNELAAGTTLAAAVIAQNRLHWLSVGDSKIYLLRGGMMYCLTKEHNYKTMLLEQLEKGEINLELYEQEIGRGDALTSYLGMGNIFLIDCNRTSFQLQNEDILLLCSDGLYKTLSEEQIQALILESGSLLKFAGQRMLEMAAKLGAGGQDNTTLILLKYLEEQREEEV